jgi:hypothetical protein
MGESELWRLHQPSAPAEEEELRRLPVPPIAPLDAEAPADPPVPREAVERIMAREIAQAHGDIETSTFIGWLERLRAELVEAVSVPAPAQEDRAPTHVCVDCGALGHAGGYHDHGHGNAGDTIALAQLPDAIRALQEDAQSAPEDRTALIEQAMRVIAMMEDPGREWGDWSPEDRGRFYATARAVAALLDRDGDTDG